MTEALELESGNLKEELSGTRAITLGTSGTIADVGSANLIIHDRDIVKWNFTSTGTTSTTLSYNAYDPVKGTTAKYKVPQGKEALVVVKVSRSGGGQFDSMNFMIWAGKIVDSKTGARNPDGRTSISTGTGGVVLGPYIFFEGEYVTIEYIAGTPIAALSEIYIVERDAT